LTCILRTLYGGCTGRVLTSKGGQGVPVMLYRYSMDRSPQIPVLLHSTQIKLQIIPTAKAPTPIIPAP
jgi:hypothetical protein